MLVNTYVEVKSYTMANTTNVEILHAGHQGF